MFKIVNAQKLNDDVFRLDVEAPFVAKKAKAGQFIIIRLDEQGERVPFTIADTDPEAGTVSVIIQKVGQTTMLLSQLKTGDYIEDFVGPLGVATDFGDAALHAMGAKVDVIAGFRSKDIVILEDEYKDICDNLYITTDDGSYGDKGFVTDKLQELIDAGNDYDLVIAIGPVVMMKFVSKVTEPYNIKTLVSLNPIMIDGTGMCGGCRVTVGGETKFACVDGPDFDGHQVDYDELMRRNAMYAEFEAHDRENCRLMKMGGAENA